MTCVPRSTSMNFAVALRYGMAPLKVDIDGSQAHVPISALRGLSRSAASAAASDAPASTTVAIIAIVTVLMSCNLFLHLKHHRLCTSAAIRGGPFSTTNDGWTNPCSDSDN